MGNVLPREECVSVCEPALETEDGEEGDQGESEELTSDPPLLSLQRLPDIFVSLYNVKRSNFLLGWIHKLNTDSLKTHTNVRAR